MYFACLNIFIIYISHIHIYICIYIGMASEKVRSWQSLSVSQKELSVRVILWLWCVQDFARTICQTLKHFCNKRRVHGLELTVLGVPGEGALEAPPLTKPEPPPVVLYGVNTNLVLIFLLLLLWLYCYIGDLITVILTDIILVVFILILLFLLFISLLLLLLLLLFLLLLFLLFCSTFKYYYYVICILCYIVLIKCSWYSYYSYCYCWYCDIIDIIILV